MLETVELLSVDETTRLQGYHWSCDKPWAVLQVTHGMAEHLLRYEALAEYLNEQGIVVIGHDHLGHGSSIQEAPKGYFHDETIKHGLVQDLYEVTQWGKKQYPKLPFFILGHSMGSFVLRNYIYDYGEELQGAILVGTGQQPVWLTRMGQKSAKLLSKIQGEKHPSKLIDRLAFGTMNRKIEAPRTDKDWLVSLPEEVDAYLADPNCGFFIHIKRVPRIVYIDYSRAKRGVSPQGTQKFTDPFIVWKRRPCRRVWKRCNESGPRVSSCWRTTSDRPSLRKSTP
jgi:alpha-beta hydrolase superfamily lysophospholipase